MTEDIKNELSCGYDLEEDLDETIYLGDEEYCPKCGYPLIILWSGVRCSSCDWWFCY